MDTIREEPEEEDVGGRGTRESLSTVQPRDRIRSVGSGWVEYVTPSGRLYYCNPETKEKSWKPPRKAALQSSSCSLPQNVSFSLDWNLSDHSRLSLHCEEQQEPANVGKILRMGVLKTTDIGGSGKKKWVKSFVVLTEFYVLFTAIAGLLEKLFKKTKKPDPCRLYLINAEVTKDSNACARANVYRLKTVSREVLFRSRNPTVAESWYQSLALVINNLRELEKPERFDLSERVRTNSFDLGVNLREKEVQALSDKKSASFSDFSAEESVTDAPRTCLSDFLGVRYPTPPGWISIYDSETEKFCYVNCITQKKWFWAMTEDGHPYFYEEDSGRRSWLLPSIYLDAKTKSLEDMRRSIGSRKSLVTDV